MSPDDEVDSGVHDPGGSGPAREQVKIGSLDTSAKQADGATVTDDGLTGSHTSSRDLEVDIDLTIEAGFEPDDGVARREPTAESLAARLVEAERQLLLDNSADVVLHYDNEAICVWASPSLEQVFGWKPSEVIGTDFLLIRPSDRGAAVDAVTSSAEAHHDGGRARVEVVCVDGRRRWSEVAYRLVWNEAGTVDAIIAAHRDVTDQVRVEEALVQSEARYRLLAEHASDLVFQADADSTLEWVSPSITRLAGWEPDAVLGHRARDFIHPDDHEALDTATVALLDGIPTRLTCRIRRTDGTYRWLDATLHPVVDDVGAVTGTVGGARDIQREVETGQALALSERRHRIAMAAAPVGMAVLDLDRRFIEVNAALCRIFGRDPDWFLTRRIADVLDPLDNEVDLRMRGDVLSGRADHVTWEQRIRRPDDTRVWVEHSVALLLDTEPDVTLYISQFVDISDAKASTDQLRYQATHDALTRVGNRRDLLDRVGAMLSHQRRGDTRLAVLFIDIDHLKNINDTYGHGAGDDAIVAIAQRITEQVRTNDDVTRFGGDEFIVVLPTIDSLENAQIVADKIIHGAIAPITIAGQAVHVSVSIGIAIAEPGDDPEHLLQRADQALYRAKQTGRGVSVTYDRTLDHRTRAHPVTPVALRNQ